MKKALSVILCIALLLMPFVEAVNAAISQGTEELAISSLEIRDIDCIENVDGYYDEGYNEEAGENVSYFRYSFTPEIAKVTLSDGTVIENEWWSVIMSLRYNYGFNVYPDYSDDQSYANQWKAGETHSAKVYLGEAEFNYNVNIIECPIESIEIAPRKYIEGTNMYFVTEYDEESNPHSYYKYRDYVREMTFHYKDGRSEFTESSNIEVLGRYFGLSIHPSQSYDNQWGLGVHTVTAEICGVLTTFTIEIVENPVQSIEVDPVERYEGLDADYGRWWDDEGNDLGTFNKYESTPDYITLKMKNGTEYSGSYGEVHYNFMEDTGFEFNLRFSDDQSEENQWGVGQHKATLKFGTLSCDYDVIISENPVERIEADPVTIVVGTRQETYWDYETGESYTSYRVPYPSYTVYYRNGSSEHLGEGYSIDIGNRSFWPSVTSDQSLTNTWGLGKHTATMTVAGVSDDFEVEIIESPILSVVIDDVVLIEGDCSHAATYDPEGNRREFNWYNLEPQNIIINLRDGTVISGPLNMISDQIYDLLNVGIGYGSDQSYDNQWGVGKHKADLTIGNNHFEYTVEIVENPIDRIEIEPITIMEGMGRRNAYEYIEDREYKYQRYNFVHPSFTVYYKDGSSQYVDRYEDYFYCGEFYEIRMSDDQGYGNEWGVGGHTATLTILGMTTPFTVEITASPIESIVLDDVQVIENRNGRYETAYGEYGEPIGEYFIYDVNLRGITVTLKDGTVLNGLAWDVFNTLSEMFGGDLTYSVEDGQSYENQWGLGEHTVTITIAGVSCNMKVNVIENPVERIEVKLYNLIEGSETQTRYEYDEELFTEFEYQVYPTLVKELTVFYKDGTSEKPEDQGIVINGEYYWLMTRDDQDYRNRWGVGKHKVIAELCGVTCEAEVEIIENPIESIKVDDIICKVNKNGYYQPGYDEEGQYVGDYYRYYTYPDRLTVKLTDGTVFSGDPFDVGDGIRDHLSAFIPWNFETVQSYNNQFTVGENTEVLTFAGNRVEYKVIVKDLPIESIKVNDMKIYLGTEGYMSYDYSAGTRKYYYYDPAFEYEITFTDGTTKTNYAYNPLIYDGENYGFPELVTDQSIENQWGVGKHNATLELAGRTCDFVIEILPSPVKSIKVDDVSVIFNADGYEYGSWLLDPETGIWQYTNIWFRYTDYPINFFVEMKDGSKIKSTGRAGVECVFDYDGAIFNIYISDDQSYENQWGIGKHTATATCSGVSCDFTVDVVPTPVKKVEVTSLPIIAGIDNLETVISKLTATVTLKDGTVLTSDENDAVTISGKKYFVYFSMAEQELVAGQSITVNASICGYKTEVTLPVIEDPFTSIKIEDRGDLYITFNKKNGSSETRKVVDFRSRGAGDTGDRDALIKTDDGNFYYATITFDVPDEDFENYGLFFLGCTDNVSVSIGEHKSNTLAKTGWLAAYSIYYDLLDITSYYRGFSERRLKNTFEGYDKSSSERDIEAIVNIAANVCCYLGAGYDEDGIGYGIFSFEDVKKAVSALFGIDDLDFTKYSRYDPSNDPDRIDAIAFGNDGGMRTDGGEIFTARYQNGKWIFEMILGEDEELSYERIEIVLDSDLHIETIKFLSDKEVAAVSIYEKPKKTDYRIGDTFKSIGLALKVRYKDGTSEIVKSGFTFDGFSSDTVGTKTVTVSYGGKSAKLELTVTDADPTYEITEGDGQYSAVGGTEDAEFRMDAPVEEFVGLKVDGVTVDPKYYTIYDGSILVEVSAEFLATLGEGEHSIEIESVGGSATSSFVVAVPEIGDVEFDGSIDENDAVALARYLAGWNVKITEEVADIDGDGEISDWDYVVLSRHLAGWNVVYFDNAN